MSLDPALSLQLFERLLRLQTTSIVMRVKTCFFKLFFLLQTDSGQPSNYDISLLTVA